MISPLCDFAHWFPSLLAHELESARREGHQWRETSLTDRMLFEIKKLHDPRIIVRTSNERVTGADMEWWFVRADMSSHLCLTVQAKILHYLVHDTARWACPELKHPPKAQGRQARQVKAYALAQTKKGRATSPLYLFYNPASVDLVSGPPWYWRGSSGAALASGYRVATHLERHRTGKTIPRDACRIGIIGPMMFPLAFIFCRGNGDLPAPEDIPPALGAAEAAIRRHPDAVQRVRVPAVHVGDGVPDDIRALVDRSGERWADYPDDPAPGQPSRVIFISD